MPKKEDEKLDPVVVAALIDDGKEDEEDKDAKKKALDEAEEAEDSEDESDDSDKEEPDEKKPDEKTPDPKKEDPKPEKKPEPKPDEGKKPEPKAGDEDLTDAEKQEQERQSRKERREERKNRFMESLKLKPSALNPRAALLRPDPNYKPIDYEKKDEFKSDELKADRDKATHNAFARGSEVERRIQEQERFWDKVEMEDQILRYNPELQFMNPDNKQEYRPERAQAIDRLFFNLIGYKEESLFDPTSRQPLYGADGKQQVRATVQRTDISYKDFVEGYVANMEDWGDESSAERSNNIVAQASTQGIRPGGGSKKGGKPRLQPGVFKNMSDEEFERTDEETDDELLSAF